MPRVSARAPRALAGIGVVLTRPVGRNAALARRVRAAGGVALALPGTSLRAGDDPAAARRALRAAARGEVTIFTSPSAVRYAFALVPALRFARRTAVLAVGPGTARALARRGVRAALPAARFDSEGLLALPPLARVRGRRVTLVKAPGGRDLLAVELAARGAVLSEAWVYRRAAARLTRRHEAALAALPRRRVSLWSSADAVAALATALSADAWRRLRATTAIASSARVAAALRAAGFAAVRRARSAVPADLLDAARAALRARVRRARAFG